MFNRIKAIAKKEIKQLLRDKRMLFVIFFFPVFLLVAFGYALNFDVKDIHLAVYDNSNSLESREFIKTFSSSDYFRVVNYIHSEKEINNILNTKKAQIVLIIPNDFSRKLYLASEKPQVQVLIDGVDGNTAAIIQNYVDAAVIHFNQAFQSDLIAKAGVKSYTPVDLRPVFWYNPDLDTTKFLVPGLIAMILIITATLTVSLSLVGEKEKGTIEQINVSSIRILELLIGKSLPFLIISLINAGLILLASYFMFGVIVKGSFLLLLLSTLIFLAASVSLGIFISTVSDSLQIAFTLATFATLLPTLILSGFVFPIENMPRIVQFFTLLSPARFFIVALRAIILKGVGLAAFWDQLLYLCFYVIVFLSLASLVQKRKEMKA
jgi:ABC-2 type transport system permease protein